MTIDTELEVRPLEAHEVESVSGGQQLDMSFLHGYLRLLTFFSSSYELRPIGGQDGTGLHVPR